jgi:hypothetical protein
LHPREKPRQALLASLPAPSDLATGSSCLPAGKLKSSLPTGFHSSTRSQNASIHSSEELCLRQGVEQIHAAFRVKTDHQTDCVIASVRCDGII